MRAEASSFVDVDEGLTMLELRCSVVRVLFERSDPSRFQFLEYRDDVSLILFPFCA